VAQPELELSKASVVHSIYVAIPSWVLTFFTTPWWIMNLNIEKSAKSTKFT
jgi:hypothetical protein